MAVIVYELPETYASITRPVALEIARQVRDKLNIVNKDVRICFPGANGKLSTWNSANIEETFTTGLPSSERLFFDIKEEYIEDDLLTMASKKQEMPPIFVDSKHNIHMYPVYSRTKVTISFTYRSADRWQAEQFRDNFRRKIAENREYMTFYARYHYPIPKSIVNALALLYKVRKVYDKEYEKFTQYLYGLGSKQFGIITNAAGKGDTLVHHDMQENIYGNFTDPTSMEVEKDDNGAAWTVSFDFEYHYDKPISVGLRYPILINNNLVPPELYPEKFFDIAKLRYHTTLTRALYDVVQQDMGFYWHMKGACIRIPDFDDWSNHKQWWEYKALVSAMLIVDTDKPKEVCSLFEIGDWGLHPVLHDAFKRNHLYLTKKREFPFFISLYQNDDYLGEDALHVDKELTVTTRREMDVFKMYHIVISVVKDIKTLTPNAQRRFFSEPALVNAWIDILLGFRPIDGYPKVNENGTVNIEDFDRVLYRNGRQRLPDNYFGLGSAMATVGIFGVVTHPENELPQ